MRLPWPGTAPQQTPAHSSYNIDLCGTPPTASGDAVNLVPMAPSPTTDRSATLWSQDFRPACSNRAWWRHLGWLFLALTGHGMAFWLVSQSAVELPMPETPPLMLTLLAPVQEPVAAENPPAAAHSLRAPRPTTVTASSAPDRELAAPGSATAPAAPSAEFAPAPTPARAAPETVPTPPPAIAPPRFDAAYLNNPRPAYPAFSKRFNEQGTVQLRAHVLPNGLPDQVEIARSSGFPRLDNAAHAAVLQWRFIPARRGSEAVAEWVVIPLAFVLEK